MSTVSNTVEVDKLIAEVQRLKVENKFLSKECERHQQDKSELRKELELQKNQAFRILHEATAEVEQRYEEAEAARRAAEEEVQQLRGRVAKLRRRVQCVFGQEDAMAAEPLTMLERLAAWSEYALPRLRHAITEARVAAARSEAAAAARSQAAAAARSLACVVCLEASRDTYLNCGHIICRVCADQVDRCPICRAPITSRSKAFV